MATKGKRWRVGIAAVLGVATAAVLALGPSPSATIHTASASTNDHTSAVEAKAAFQDALEELHNRMLLQFDGRYQIHRLTYTFLRVVIAGWWE